ncbi:hypothetical protein [Streptomyces sp. NPDC057429]|uniref:hypothetical protein n=1 Tax=Streptomyces sp. NPDC057429 TaxID=3346130 RepID=UPI00369FD801
MSTATERDEVPEIVRWLTNWHASHAPGLRSRGVRAELRQPAPGTAAGGRPKATAVSLTLESGERLGKLYVWGPGSASLLFIDSRTAYTLQEHHALTSESDLSRILLPLVELVEASAGHG